MKTLSTAQKSVILGRFPELRDYIEQHETKAMLAELLNRKPTFEGAEMIKGAPGSPGKDGKTPVKGVDYLTPEEIEAIKEHVKTLVKSDLTPVKGRDYFTEPEIRQIAEMARPKLGRDYFNGRHGNDGRDGRDGMDGLPGPRGKDGTEIAPKDIAAKLNTLKKALKAEVLDLPSVEELIDTVVKELKNPKSKRRLNATDINMNDMRWHGGGISSVVHDNTLSGLGTSTSPLSVVSAGGITILTATGTIDDSNTAFTFISLPTELVINGSSYIQTGGAITWSWNAGTFTATLSSPVGSGGSIYGRA